MNHKITTRIIIISFLLTPGLILAENIPGLTITPIPLAQTTSYLDTQSAIYNMIREFKQGTRSEGVKELQTALKTDRTIYPEGYVTGYYGPLTAKAVGRFQKKYGINSMLPAVTDTATSSTASTVSVSWNTDKPTRTKVWFGSVSPTNTALNPINSNALTQNHATTFSGLTASTTYYYIIGATDLAGNKTLSPEGSFTTLAQ